MKKKQYHCPWCSENISIEVVRDLTKISTPCPFCDRPIRESIWQVIFVVILLLPLIALFLYLSKLLYDLDQRILSVLILIIGGLVSVYIQKYIPTIDGPRRGV